MRLWTTSLITLAAVTTIAWLVALMHEKNIRPVQDLVAFFKTQSKAGRVLLGTFFIAIWVIASTKPGGGGNGGADGGGGDGGTNNVQMVIGPGGGLQPMNLPGTVTDNQQQVLEGGSLPPQGGLVGDPVPVTDQWSDFAPFTSTNTTRTLTGDDFRRGFVLTRIGTDEAFSFVAPVGANVCADWRAFGASEDWMYLAFNDWSFCLGTNEVDRLRVFSFGKAEPLPSATNRWFAPLIASLGVVPQANWPLVVGNEGAATPEDLMPSQFWHFVTPSNTLQLTWQNVLFERLTNTPVSVQMEVWPSGRFAYRYDLSRLGFDEVTNILVGASFGGLDWATSALPTNLTSFSFYPLAAEDAVNADRDGDGLSLLDELFAFGTDPALWDTDFDGISDGDEVAVGMNPLARDTDVDGYLDGTDHNPLNADSWAETDGDGLPDAWKDGWFGTNVTVAASGDANTDGVSNIASLLMGLNPVMPGDAGFAYAHGIGAAEINAWVVVPVAFSFSRPAGLTNLVSRTFTVKRESPWEQFFVSARPDCAAGWETSDVALLYGLDGEPATNTVPSVSSDSWRIPLGDTMPQSVSVRILATGDTPCLSAPLYLLRWTPHVEFLPSANVMVVNATNGRTYAAAKRNPDTGAYEVPFHADTAKIPHRAGIDAAVAADLALPPVEYVSVLEGTPRVFTASDPLMTDLPCEGTNLPKRLLFYSIDFSRTGAVSSGPRASQYASPYPLTSSSLRKSFHAATGVTADGSVTLTLSPDVPELGYTTGLPVLCGGLRLLGATSGGSKSDTITPPTTVTPTVCGDSCSNDTHNVEYEYPEDHDETPDEDDDTHEEDDDDCECCDDGGSSLGSFRIRIPFGESAKDEHLGYLWTVMEGPTAITPSAFGVLAAQGVTVVTNANGTLAVSCSAGGGKSLTVTNITHGVAVSVWNSSGRFESRWEVFNEGGDTSLIRVRRITVLGNATVDETYATWHEDAPIVFGETRDPATAWAKTDNIRGVTRTRWEWRDGSVSGFVAEEYEETSLGSELVRAEQRIYAKVGEGTTARRRLAYTYGYDENGRHESSRTYWCDTDHPDRHARLKSVHSTRRPWAWYDYDASGREIVRIEQLDGSGFPDLSEVSPDACLPQWCSVKVTVTDYTPQDSDDAHRNDSFEPREISVYVRKDGGVPILVSHENRVYTRETDAAGNPLRRMVKNIGLDGAVRTETTLKYPQDSAVPSHLRGLSVSESNEDGSVTSTSYSLSNGCLVAASHTTFNGVERQTDDVMVTDAAYRLPLRGETRLSSNGALLEWSERTYDDIRRLRSVVYSDGTLETNAYSCCRLLWRRDREGRRVLRSAQTGSDSLYNADEDVWLADVSSNGTFRIVQHHFDGFGRETDTLIHLGSIPGEATVAYTPTAEQSPSERTTEYLDGDTNGASERIDERGKVTAGSSGRQVSSEQTWESVYGADGFSETLSTTSTRYRNGGTATERRWSGGWRREAMSVGYGANGSRFEVTTVEASGHAMVTNAVITSDALGRTSSAWTPNGETAFIYDGASSRMLRMEFAAGAVERTTHILHNASGEQVGTVLDGVTNRSDVTYVEMSNAWWRVTTNLTVGPDTNAVTVVKEQMSGLGGGIRGRTASIDGAGLETRSEKAFDEGTGIETETETASDGTWKVVRRKHGLVLETETAAGRTVSTYDGFGRVVGVQRSVGTGGDLQPVSRTEYTPWGDVTAVETYTNGVDTVRESYGYDEFGNRVAATNALGQVVETDYDAFGNVTAMHGATYPVEIDYDTESRRIALRTTRDGSTWDETRWAYDAATGNCLSKTYADNSEVASFNYNSFLNEIAFSNDVASANLDRDARGNCTNDAVVVGNEVKTTSRTFDAFSRLTGVDDTIYDYSANGLLASISNVIAVVNYAYTPDRLDAGYSLTLSNGVVFTRSILRDGYRRSLETNISCVANGVSVGSLWYTYDALNRPTARNTDTFGYNARSEVVFSRRSEENAENAYSYDDIGNLLFSAFNSATNTYTANNLNQYTTILRVSASPREILHDADGNMTQCGDWTYAYDAANRLKTVSSNGMLLVTNFYDAKSRRVKKITAESTSTFFYDGWNLIEERVTHANGTSTTIRYYWGTDLSGTLQGSGGVGGLLYLTIDGVPFIPCYDNNGNIMRSLDVAGNTVAQYTYDAFGAPISQSGAMCDVFRHRFSTKYYDAETCLYSYEYRYYHPALMRWLNRDPIGVRGGLNLYGFCGNNAINQYDIDGRAVRIVQNGREITVTVNITIYYAHRLELNARTDLERIARRIKKQIEEKWNAQTWRYGCCNVNFKANVKYRNQVGRNGLTDDNLIAISTDPNLRSVVNGVGGNAGYWNADNVPGSDWQYAHEAGHLMGLDDDYTDDPITGESIPHSGHENHMMGEHGGTVRQHEIEDLLRANNVRCNR